MMLKNRSLAVVAIIAVLGVFVVYTPAQARATRAEKAMKAAATDAEKAEKAAKAAKELAKDIKEAKDKNAVKLSAFSPADDLSRQVAIYIKSMKDVVADEKEYKDSQDKLARESNTLVVIALALGLHDQSNKYKAGAGDLMKAAQDVAATKDYASAKKAVDALEKAASTKTKTKTKAKTKASGDLKWERVASLPELMKQVPILHTKLKLKTAIHSDIKNKAGDTLGYSAVIAAIAQATVTDTSATKNAEEVKQWEKFSVTMRNNAGEVNTAIHIGNIAATGKAMEKLNKSCEKCHAVFKPDVVIDDCKEEE